MAQVSRNGIKIIIMVENVIVRSDGVNLNNHSRVHSKKIKLR